MKKVFDIAPLVLKNVNREAEEDVFARGLTSGLVCKDRALSIESYERSLREVRFEREFVDSGAKQHTF